MAKKFNFRLESVLKLREHHAKAEKQTLMQIMGMRYQKENEISERESYYNSLLKGKKGKFPVTEFQAQFAHQNFIKAEIKKLNDEKEQLVEIENIQREKLNTAKKEEKIISKLKEKKKLTYFDELNKEEVKVLDEIAQNRHGKFEL
jgi:flagellar export protein FliJ